jgi:predicted GTPase/uncharacterized protein YecA (UPF0149 family)
MANYQEQKQKILQLFQHLEILTESQKQPEIKKSLQAAKTRLIQDKLFVVVCGEFKQGKSSLLNAMLNETGLFPVDVDIATNLVSSIAYGQQEKITVVLGESGREETKQISRVEIPTYVTEQGNRGNTKKARMLVIEAPNSELKEGLCLVDTPGVGGLNVEHTALTYAFIPNADAVLFVSDAFAPLSEKELKFISERITPHCQNLIFVVTKIDAVSNYETIIQSNREKLAQVLNRSPEKISIIPVSSANKLAYLQSQDLEDLEDSNFASLESELWQLINQHRGKTLLTQALSEIAQSTAQIIMPLEAELSAYQRENQNKSQDLKQQFQLAKDQLQTLLNNNAEWQNQLNYGLDDIKDNILSQFQTGFTRINAQAEKYLNDNRLLESPKEIANLLEIEIDALMSDLGKQLSEMAANLHAQIEITTNMNFNPFEVNPFQYQKAQIEIETVNVKKAGVWEKSIGMVRGATYGASPGAMIGGVLFGLAGGAIGLLFGGVGAAPGAQIGAYIGAALGGIAGTVTGAKQQLSQLDRNNKGLIKSEVAPIIKQFLQQTQHSCQQSLMAGIKPLGRSMKDELTRQIRQERTKCEEVLESIKKAEGLSSDKVNQRTIELKKNLQQILQIRQQVDNLAQATL